MIQNSAGHDDDDADEDDLLYRNHHHSHHSDDDDDADDSHCRPVVPMLERLVPLSRGALTSTNYVIVIMMMIYQLLANSIIYQLAS